MMNVRKKIKQYKQHLEYLEDKTSRLDRLIHEIETRKMNIEDEKSEIIHKITNLKQSICKHTELKVMSWKITEDNKGTQKIKISQRCQNCDAVLEAELDMRTAIKFLGLNDEPKTGRTYFLSVKGSVYYICDNEPIEKVASIHLEKQYLEGIRNLIPETPCNLLNKLRERKRRIKKELIFDEEKDS